MRFWALVLRVLGAAELTWSVFIQLRQASQTRLSGSELFVVSSLLDASIIAALCFGVAAGLDKLSQTESRPVSAPDQKPQVRRSIAPVALNLPDSKARPPEPEKDDHEQRIARRKRYRISERRHIGVIAKDMVQDAKENPEGKSGQRFSSKKRL